MVLFLERKGSREMEALSLEDKCFEGENVEEVDWQSPGSNQPLSLSGKVAKPDEHPVDSTCQHRANHRDL